MCHFGSCFWSCFCCRPDVYPRWPPTLSFHYKSFVLQCCVTVMIAEELPTVSVLVCQRDLSGHVQKSTMTSHWEYQNRHSSIIFCLYRSCFDTWSCFRKIISVSWLVGSCKQKAATSAEPTSWKVSHLSQHCLFREHDTRILLHDIFCHALRFWGFVLVIHKIIIAKTGCQCRKHWQHKERRKAGTQGKI